MNFIPFIETGSQVVNREKSAAQGAVSEHLIQKQKKDAMNTFVFMTLPKLATVPRLTLNNM